MNNTNSCNYFDSKRCNSCHFLSYPKTEITNQKMALLKDIFKDEISSGLKINEILECQNTFHSRAKAKFSIGGTFNNPIIGITNRKLEITELENCPLHYEKINSLLPILKDLIKQYKISPYIIKSKSGELKGIIIKSNAEQDQFILRFILKSKKYLNEIQKLVKTIQDKFNYVKVISINIQPVPHQILEGDEEIILSKQSTILEKHGDIHLIFGPKSFSQVTPYIAHKLYQKMAKIISKNKCEGLLDLFCGVGGFSINAADFIKWGIGIEISPQAIEYATLAAKENDINHLKFISDDVESYLNNYNFKKPDVVICNPPRRGLYEKICDQLKVISPELILYSSCNPITLQKDLMLLSSQYNVEELTPFDMFPLTKHMEILVILRKKIEGTR